MKAELHGYWLLEGNVIEVPFAAREFRYHKCTSGPCFEILFDLESQQDSVLHYRFRDVIVCQKAPRELM